jgi:hypothetical protein
MRFVVVLEQKKSKKRAGKVRFSALFLGDFIDDIRMSKSGNLY